jgi:hypothetical protein
VRLYTVHQGPSPAGRGDDVVFIRDGFSWLALIVPPLWALYRALWLVVAGIAVLALAINGLAQWTAASSSAMVAVILAAVLLFAFEANDLWRWTLRRRGFRDVAIVAGRSLADAELRFFQAVVVSPTGMLIPRDEI